MVISSFRDLDAYQLAMEASLRIYTATLGFPAEETYRLTDQVRRSSRAVSALIAEAWARRRYTRAFIEKINQALSETMETQVWLDHALQCGFIDDSRHAELNSDWQRLGGMLQQMIFRAPTFRPRN